MSFSSSSNATSASQGAVSIASRLVVKNTFLEINFRENRLTRSFSEGHLRQESPTYSSPSGMAFSSVGRMGSEKLFVRSQSATGSTCSHTVEVLSDTDDTVEAAAAVSAIPDGESKTSSHEVAEELQAEQWSLGESWADASARTAAWHCEMVENADDDERAAAGGELTTIILRNLPLQYTRSMVLEMLDFEGFRGCYDFVYLPSSFDTGLGFGYAFVNFTGSSDAIGASQHFRGFSKWKVACKAECETSWSDPHQGFEANVARYRNSPVMHDSIPDERKPIILDKGARIAFPSPTRRIKIPKSKGRSAPAQVVACLAVA